ncbi:MAG: SpaA isopeptide-forming pilin-related protein [Coprobacillaceae bacterium]
MFNIKLIPLDEKLREHFTVTVPVTVINNQGVIQGVEGILFNTPYYIEEENTDNYFVTYYVKSGVNGTKEKKNYFEITDVNTAIELTVENEPRPVTTPFSFIKIKGGSQNEPLLQAGFMLYQCKEKHNHEDFVTDQIVADGHCWKPISDSLYISQEDGLIEFAALIDGQYILVERLTPDGYDKPIGQWKITVDSTELDDKIKIDYATGLPKPPAFKIDKVNNTYYLPNNKKVDLPTSGSGGIIPFIIFGIGTVIVSGLLLFDYKRKKKVQKPRY